MTSNAAPCLVVTPFGKKTDATGVNVDFDAVYSEIIKPAVLAAGFEPIRTDEFGTVDLLQKLVFERLISVPVAIFDLTTSNPNVFYELGIRHGVRPGTTLLMAAENSGRMPFDLAALRTIPYRLTPNGTPADPRITRETLTSNLREAGQREDVDSPLFQLLQGHATVTYSDTDVLPESINDSQRRKEQLGFARREGLSGVKAFEQSLGENLGDVESAVLVDLFLSYRAVRGWQEMIDLAARMPRAVAETVLVQEQLALALNRAGRDVEAEKVLHHLLTTRGPSSETYGLLGRIYKDRWERSRSEGRGDGTLLDRAIEAYLRGFESDTRDAYPGVNAVTLMELRDPPDERRKDLIPVVRYAVKRRLASTTPDYWDFATLLELAVLANDEAQARDAFQSVMSSVRETWEAETTARNLRLIRNARLQRREPEPPWLTSILSSLESRAA